MSKTILSNLLVFVLVAVVLGILANARIDSFRDYHNAIAQESVSSGAQIVENFIAERKRLVYLFAQDNIEYIKRIAADPDNIAIQEEFQQRIKRYFPDHFSYTIADTQGVPYVEDFDGLVGDLCKQDLMSYANTGTQSPRIHPHPDVYHFDISAKIKEETNTYIMFISFHADLLGSFIKSAQTKDHQVALLIEDASFLIEATEMGARDKLDRIDFRMTDSEQARIITKQTIPNTSWTIVDMHTPELFTRFETRVIWFTVVVLLIFFLIIAFMTGLVRYEEKRRRAAEKHKEEFLSVVSHELRTPITSIRGSVALVANGVAGDMSDKAKELLDISVNNCDRLNMLINDLLDVQKIEAGKMKFEISPVDVTEIIDQSIEMNRAYAEKLHCQISFVGDKLNKKVMADTGRIIQVMTNLISNAVKYGAENGIVEISMEERDAMLRVNVTDHGKGIPDSFRRIIFDKFEQSSSADNRQVQGTGLGLSIVKHIVEQHNGAVDFVSSVGKGTTFYIELPIVQS